MIIPADPASFLDYTWDWTAWLADGEAIASATVTAADPGVSISQVGRDTTTVTAWITPGVITTSRAARDVVCHITTTAGRVDDRTITLSVQDR